MVLLNHEANFQIFLAKLVVVSNKKSFPLVGLLGLPVTNAQKVEALKSINGFFSGTVSDSGVDLQASKVCTMTLSAQCCHPHNVY